MLEYIFFHATPWEHFIDFLQARGLAHDAAQEEQGFMVRIPEETDDGLMDEIEAYYDRLLDMNEALFIAEEEGQQVHTAGVSVNLSDGRSVQAAVDPKLLNRILESVSIDELGVFINAIVDAVENPDERPFCQRVY
ncbi:MAG: hypothetical protein C0631_01490 [Sedimenticola sp.]|nr:MAG: hypothetical protein C0631_01490 [Sedimenticola sp.]